MFTIYRRHPQVVTFAALLVVYVLLIITLEEWHSYSLPKVKDGWRTIEATEPNSVAVGWSDGMGAAHAVRLNLATAKWWYSVVWSMDTNGDALATGGPNLLGGGDTLLTLKQRVDIRAWAKSLPPSDNGPSANLRLRIAVNLDGAQHAYEYTVSEMPQVITPLSKILETDFFYEPL